MRWGLVTVLSLAALSVAGLAGCSAAVHGADGGVDAGPSATLDVIGSWHTCEASVTYREDGTASRTEHRAACTRPGRWQLLGDRLEVTWQAGDCEDGPMTSTHRAVRVGDGLIQVDPATGRVTSLAGDATPHTLWRLEGSDGATTRATVASIVGDPEDEFGSGCYWSADGACGGHFSCSGQFLVWTLEGDRFSGSTACSGGCPCGAVLNGVPAEDGTIDVNYRGVNCDRSYEGALIATPLE